MLKVTNETLQALKRAEKALNEAIQLTSDPQATTEVMLDMLDRVGEGLVKAHEDFFQQLKEKLEELTLSTNP